MHNGGMKDFGDRRYGMQVSLRIGLPEADRPINHLTCPTGVVLNVTEHAPPPSLMNHIPHLCLALLLENNTRRQTAPLHHRTVLYPESFHPIIAHIVSTQWLLILALLTHSLAAVAVSKSE